ASQEPRDQGPPQGEEEHRSGRSPHQEHVQQHHRHDHRPDRCGDLVGLCRHRRLQGLAQVHPVRRSDGRRGRWSSGDGARHEEDRRLRQGPRLRARDRDPLPGCHRPRGRHHPGRHAHAPQRMPAAQAPSRL
ncbi:MAG: SSU ribosomal protein S11p (S14e), partial [uncultured Nocardioides sp.]